jgi:hypothetical protein
MILPDITSKSLNKQKINLIKVKEFLNIINKEKKDIYMKDIVFKGEDIKDFLKKEKMNLKQFKKLFSRTSFTIKMNKQHRIKQITDINKSEFVFTNDILKKCSSDSMDYVLSKDKTQNINKYSCEIIRSKTGEIIKKITPPIDLMRTNHSKDYFFEVINMMKKYKQTNKKVIIENI